VGMSIDAQISDMAALWPNMKLQTRGIDWAAWRGPLRPLLQTFDIGIYYRAPPAIEMVNIRALQPTVRVLSPPLRCRRGDAEGLLPHVYYEDDGNVSLCMLDPDSDDWSPWDSLARTTVPWTIEWVAAYEGWRATNEWKASGRHISSGSNNV